MLDRRERHGPREPVAAQAGLSSRSRSARRASPRQRGGGASPSPSSASGCRLPGGATTRRPFWRLLRDGVDAIGPVPAERWDVDAVYDPIRTRPDAPPRAGAASCAQVDRFDPEFFGISPREAHGMDPQQRLLLEVSWEALEHAGLAPGSAGALVRRRVRRRVHGATTPTSSSKASTRPPRRVLRVRASRAASPRDACPTCSACRVRA